MPTRNKNFKTLLFFLGLGIITVIILSTDMFGIAFKHVQTKKTDYSFSASEIVNDYLTDSKKSDGKYFEEGGYPKVLKIIGTVAELYENAKGQKIVLLKGKKDKAGVIATFGNESNSAAEDIVVGDQIIVKGVIRTGAYFDTDLEIYEDVILDKSEIVSVK
jgi:hypothetical protein